MAEQDKTVEIGIELDRQAESRFASSIDAATAKMKSLGAATHAAGNEFPPVARSTELFMQGLTRAAEAAKHYEDNIANATDETRKFNQEQNNSGGGFDIGVSGLRRTGGALSQLGLGAIGQPVSRIGDIAQVGKELSGVTDAVTGLGVASAGTAIPLAAAAVAIGTVVVALNEYNETVKKGESAIESIIKTSQTYYDFIATATTKEAEDKIKGLNDNSAKLKQRQEDDLKIIKPYFEGIGINVLGEGSEYIQNLKKSVSLVGYDQAIMDAIKDFDALQSGISDNDIVVGRLTGDIKSGTLAANDFTNAILADAKAARDKLAQDQADEALTQKGVQAVKDKIKAQEDTLALDNAELEQLLKSGDTSAATTKRIQDLQTEIGNLNGEIFKLQYTTLNTAQSIEDLNKKLAADDKAMTERADAQSKADDKRVQDMATAVAKADDDIAKITEQGLQKKIDIEKKYQDALLQAATRAAQQAADDLQRLYDQRAQNELSFQRGEADAQAKAQYDQLGAQIKYQEETAKSYQEHYDRLADIQRNAQQQNVQNILDRNFLAIFQNQLSTSASMQNENIAFGRSERGRAQQEQAAQADNQRQMAFDHQQRLIAYERANADARTQYEIQIRDNHIAEQRAIEQARRAKTQELNDLSAATNQALSIRRQGLIAELQLITQGETQKLAIQQQFYQRALNYLNSASRGATVNMTYNVGNNAGRSEILQATARQTTQIVRQVFSAGGVQLVSS